MATQFAHSGGSLTPVNPEQPNEQLEQERQHERINAPRLTKYLNRTLDAIASLDQEGNLRQHNVMVRAGAYYDGRFDGHPENGTWVDHAPIPGEIIVRDNDFKKQVDKLNMEMCRSRIRYQVEPVDKSNAAMREAAEFRTRRLEVNQERIEVEPFIQAENLSLLLKTIAFRYSFFDQTADSQEKATELNVVKQMVAGEQVEVCRTCGMQSQQGYQCPHCGDTNTNQLMAPPREQTTIEQRKVPAGRVVTVRPDATMVQLDLNARAIADSSFIRWRIVMRRCDWEAMYPNTRIPSNDKDWERQHRTDLQAHPSNSGWDNSGDSDDGAGSQFEKIEGELVWLDPKVYARYASREAEQIGDFLLPAGTKLTNAKYGEGCCVARIGHKILDLYPSNKNKCWTMCVYGMREHALHGSGTTALLGPQDIINEQNAAILAHLIYMSSGREFVRSGALEGNDLPPIDKVGVVNNAPEDRDLLAWAYGRSQPHGLSGEVYAFREAMRASQQDAAGTSSLSLQGAADMKALGTATGVEASRDQAIGRMIPNRKLQAYAGAQWAEQVLRLEHENYTPEVFLDYATKGDERGNIQFTERGVQASFQASHSDFLIKPVEGSWVPISPQQLRANATEFATVSRMLRTPQGGTDEEKLSIIAPHYGINYDVNEWGGDQRMASMRLQEYARAVKSLGQGQPPLPEVVNGILAQCEPWAQVNPEMDRHSAYRDWYQDWFISDEGKRSDPLLRAVIQRVYQLHGEGMVSTQQQVNADAAKAQLPTKLAQNVAREIDHQQGMDQQEDMAQAQEERALGQMVVQHVAMPPEPESKQSTNKK